MYSRLLAACISVTLLISLVTAYEIEYDVYNSISSLPIWAANVSLINESFTLSNTTSSLGTAFIYNSSDLDYNVEIYRTGYARYNSRLSVKNDSYHRVELIPLSTEGIIKLRVNDLTLSSHSFCLYWQDNNRLYKCYTPNDTYITVHNNVNYTLTVDINKYDLISNTGEYANNLYIILPMLLGLFVFALLIAILIGLIMFVYRRISKK
jgi:hypothetical protein